MLQSPATLRSTSFLRLRSTPVSTTAIVLIVFLIVLQILFLIACTMKRDSIESAILHFISMVWRNDAEGAISLVSTFDDKTLITKSRDLDRKHTRLNSNH